MLHRNVKDKGILLHLTRNHSFGMESSDRLIEEPFTTFHNRTLIVSLSGMFVVYSPLPFETFIKMSNLKTFAKQEKWLEHQEVIPDDLT